MPTTTTDTTVQPRATYRQLYGLPVPNSVRKVAYDI